MHRELQAAPRGLLDEMANSRNVCPCSVSCHILLDEPAQALVNQACTRRRSKNHAARGARPCQSARNRMHRTERTTLELFAVWGLPHAFDLKKKRAEVRAQTDPTCARKKAMQALVQQET